MSSISDDDGLGGEPSAPFDEPSPVARRSPRLWPWLTALGLYWAISFTLSFLRPELDEPFALRWLRALDEHPLRAVLAVGLLIVGWLGLLPTSTDVARADRDDLRR